jgi:acetyl esterase/lipase
VVYVTVDGKPLALDVHIPPRARHPPLVVFVHGGAWTTGNKTQYPAFSYSAVSRSRASTSVHQNDARFPTDVYDIKAGKRFLRARAADYGYRSDRIDIVGASSGGHLAALVGVTNVLMRLVNAAGRR